MDDLDSHKIIVYGEETRPPVPTINWLLTVGGREDQPRDPVLTVNNAYAILRAVQSGLGVAGLAEFMAAETPGLVRVLPDIQGPRVDTYFVYPEELRNSSGYKSSATSSCARWQRLLSESRTAGVVPSGYLSPSSMRKKHGS